jgi:hypothetical protein
MAAHFFAGVEGGEANPTQAEPQKGDVFCVLCIVDLSRAVLSLSLSFSYLVPRLSVSSFVDMSSSSVCCSTWILSVCSCPLF